MNPAAITFQFEAHVPMSEVEATLRLALVAAESLHGEDRVRLETRARVDRPGRLCLIETLTEAGRTLALVFGGFVRREFGDDAVAMVRMPPTGERILAGASP